jgi:hypothetical protein
MARWGSSLAVCLLGLIFSAFIGLAAAFPPAPEFATAQGWLEHANTLTNIREPGDAPFRLKVTFHAYPGFDFSRKGKPGIITGDGTYEETWLSPEQWRREISFPGYHAVEIRANAVRKYHADSDYEPSRVLMMLDALLYPVPLNFYSREYPESSNDWKIEHLTAGSLAYVSLTHRDRGMNDDWFYYSYSVLPSGILVRSSYLGLVTSWSQDTLFARKVVPQHFEVQAMGKTLLTADVTITAAGAVDARVFEMDGPPATPGLSMRPFHMFEIKLAAGVFTSTFVGPSPRGSYREIVDRRGQVREVEVIDSATPQNDENQVDADRTHHFSPAKVDRDPCEETFWVKE